MDSEHFTPVEKIISVANASVSDIESEKEFNVVDTPKENKRYITPAQSKKLFLFMESRDGFSKGKMKSTDESTKLLDEWNQLTLDLNAMGPPSHSSSEWRRTWTRLKSKNKRKMWDASVLRDDNKRVKDHPTSSVKQGNAISTNGVVKSKNSPKIELSLLESMSKKLDSFVKNQELVNEQLNQKIDRIIELQEIANVANDKLIRVSETLSNIFSADVDI